MSPRGSSPKIVFKSKSLEESLKNCQAVKAMDSRNILEDQQEQVNLLSAFVLEDIAGYQQWLFETNLRK